MFLAQTPWELIEQDFTRSLDAGWALLVLMRLTVAALLGAVLGVQRERAGKTAGLRTHMLVAVGSAFFILSVQLSEEIDLSRVIQGIITGIGFIGGGTILKLSDEQRVKGLTTASGIWLTAAVGVAAGLGHYAAGVIGTLIAWLILSALLRLEQHLEWDTEDEL